MIEYSFHLHDSHLHGFSLQLLDDLNVPASFIGIGPTGKHAIIPKLDVRASSHLHLLVP